MLKQAQLEWKMAICESLLNLKSAALERSNKVFALFEKIFGQFFVPFAIIAADRLDNVFA
jgi:hypothetical protein